MSNLNPIDILVDSGYGNAIIFRNPSYTDAIIGVTKDNNVVYNSSYYYGKGYPVIYYEFCDEDEEQIEFIPLDKLKNNI